jgi:hypothetical protein
MRLYREIGRYLPILSALALCMVTLSLCTGCLAVRSQTRAHRHKAPKPKSKPQPEIPGGVTGEGWHMHWRKQTKTGAIPILNADAEAGAFDALTDSSRASVAMQRVQAQLFQQGKLAALLTAPKLVANQSAERVVGTGGVTIHSAPGQPISVLTADQVTWDVRKELIVAEGHVHYERHPDTTLDGDTGTYDLRKGLDEIEIH